jgi:hypothetical protein
VNLNPNMSCGVKDPKIPLLFQKLSIFFLLSKRYCIITILPIITAKMDDKNEKSSHCLFFYLFRIYKLRTNKGPRLKFSISYYVVIQTEAAELIKYLST